MPDTTRQVSRRTFLRGGLLLGGGAALGALGFGAYEPYELSLTTIDIRLPRFAPEFDGFRLVQISDLHFGEYIREEHVAAVVDRVNGLNPDLVVITGDFVTSTHSTALRRKAAQQIWPCALILKGIRASHGVVATLGNHDFETDPDLIAEALKESGIEVLRNEALPIEVHGARFWFVGLDDATAEMADPDRALHGVPRDEPAVLAVHEPDFADVVAEYAVDLQISGHSHGGQVRLPLIGAPYLPPMGRKYPIGLRSLGPLQLYTNRGIGVVGAPFRFMCPPEVTLFRFSGTQERRSG
jgi:predicted MPP superfamily phosphohydrolase